MFDYAKLNFDEYFWLGQHPVQWLGLETEFLVFTDNDDETPITESQKQAIELILSLPIKTRDAMAKAIIRHYRRQVYGHIDGYRADGTQIPKDELTPPIKNQSDLWPHLSQPGFNIPSEDTISRSRYFAVSFSCDWDEEHGLSILFNHRGKPTKIGGGGDHF